MKIVAVASGGGHWVQLQRIIPAFQNNEIIYISTHASFALTVKEHEFYTVPDANRWKKFRLLLVGYKIFNLLLTLKPDVVITTGAAPGVIGILVGKIIGARTIWLDSIANVEKISLSGKLALRFADRVYTQWPALATDDIKYAGNVLS